MYQTKKIKELITKVDNLSKKNNLDNILYLDTSNLVNNRIIELQELNNNFPSRAKQIIKKGDILLSQVRPYLNHNGIITKQIDGLIASTGFSVLRVTSEINEYYLFYLLQSGKYKERINMLADTSGSTYPSFKHSDLINTKIDFVTDVIEQKKIGYFFKEIDELIELKEKELSIFEKKLDYYNNVFLSTKHNKCNCFLKDVCYEEKSNLTESRLNKDDIENYNVIDGSLNFIGKTDDVSNDDYVALVKDGYVGKIKYMKKNTNVTSSLIRLKSEKINSISLFYTLRTINFNRYKEGSTIKHLYFKHIKKIPIYIPENIKSLSNILYELDEIVSIKKEETQLLKSKKTYYLNKIFC